LREAAKARAAWNAARQAKDAGLSHQVGEAEMAELHEMFGGLEEAVQERIGELGKSGTVHVEITTDADGHGIQTAKSVPTFKKTISGSVQITAPDGGAWRILATDLQAEKTVFDQSGMVKGKDYGFGPYTTGWSAQLEVKVWWSQEEATTLKADISYSIT
jgi:hypothetical protein